MERNVCLNCTFMELKEADWELEEALEDCLNCTFMELKGRNKLLVGIRWYSLNCTLWN